VSTTISGQLAPLTRTLPERVAVLDWALNKAARMITSGRNASAQVETQTWAEIVSDGQAGHVYNEEAFRYFLEIEEKRAERSQVPFFLLLIAPRQHPRAEQPFSPANASRLFDVLKHVLRDTDFTGWYRQDFVAGAVLTQLGPAGAVDVSRLITERVSAALGQGLPGAVADRLDIQIYEMPMAPRAVVNEGQS